MSMPKNIPDAASPEIVQNQNNAAQAWTFCYANDPDVNDLLHRGYSAGRWGGFDVVDVDHTFGTSTTTYVSAKVSDGTLNFSTSNTNFNDGTNYKRVETVVTDGTGITTVTDYRGGPGGAHGGAGGAGGGSATKVIQLAASDETTALTTGTAKLTFRMPYAMTVSAVRASLTTAQASGSIFTVDINESGTTILSTKLTIDNTEKTSTTAATAAVISDTSLADDAEITIDIDQVGASGATGLKITLIGT